jgi:hypothetical protein
LSILISDVKMKSGHARRLRVLLGVAEESVHAAAPQPPPPVVQPQADVDGAQPAGPGGQTPAAAAATQPNCLTCALQRAKRPGHGTCV